VQTAYSVSCQTELLYAASSFVFLQKEKGKLKTLQQVMEKEAAR
jgi:hypothetical protein